jgi:hypothetical protein
MLVHGLAFCFFSHVSMENVGINDRVLKALARNKGLDTLHMAMATGFTSQGLKDLFIGCEDLRELNISWTVINK